MPLPPACSQPRYASRSGGCSLSIGNSQADATRCLTVWSLLLKQSSCGGILQPQGGGLASGSVSAIAICSSADAHGEAHRHPGVAGCPSAARIGADISPQLSTTGVERTEDPALKNQRRVLEGFCAAHGVAHVQSIDGVHRRDLRRTRSKRLSSQPSA